MKDLKLSLIVSALDRATAPLRRVGASLKGLEAKTNSLKGAFHKLRLAEMIGGAALIGGVTAAAAGILNITNKTAEMGEGFLHAAQKAGVTAETIQKLSYAAKQVGVDPEILGHGLALMERNTVAALLGQKQQLRAFAALKITTPQLKLLSGHPDEAFNRIMDGLKGISNGAVRAWAAMTVFGRAGFQMLPMAAGGSAAIKKFGAELAATGAIMGKDDVEAAEKYIQAKNKMGAAIQGLEIKIGNQLIPTLTAAIGKMTDWVEHMKPGELKKLTSSINLLVGKIPELLPKVLDLAAKFLALAGNGKVVAGAMIALGVALGVGFVANIAMAAAGIVALAPAIVALAVAAWPFVLAGAAIAAVAFVVIKNWKPISAFFKGFWAGFSSVAAAGVASLKPLWTGLVGFVKGLFGSFASYVSSIWSQVAAFAGAAVRLTKGVWAPIAGFFKGYWALVGGIFSAFWKFVAPMARVGLKVVTDAWSGLTGWFGKLWSDIENAFSGAWKKLAAMTPDWLKTLLKVGAIGLTATMAPALASAAMAPTIRHLAHAAPTPGPARAIGRPGAGGTPGAAGKPGAAAANGKVAVHVHVTSDGQPKVKSVSASGDATASVSRGVFPG